MSSTVPLISVLVVHEQREMCQLWQRILNLTPGMACPAYATDGTGVLQQVAELAPDVVVLGASLPTTDGLDLTRQILAQHPETLLIVYSVQDREETALAAGAAACLTLPVSTDTLTRTIRQVYKQQQRR